ncbi:uncharacterized protein ISCGN_024417 [Ixodes scapularis]
MTGSFVRLQDIMLPAREVKPPGLELKLPGLDAVDGVQRRLQESPPPPELPVFGTFFRALVPMATPADVGRAFVLFFCAVLNVALTLDFILYPSLTPFRCDDPSLQAVYGKEVLNTPSFIAVVIAVATFTIAVLEVRRAAPVLDRAYWLGRILRRYVLCLFILNIAVHMVKFTVNSKRPHFIDSCKPAAKTPSGTLLVCTGEVIEADNVSSVNLFVRKEADADAMLEAENRKVITPSRTRPPARREARFVSSVVVYSTVFSSLPRTNDSRRPSGAAVGTRSSFSAQHNLSIKPSVVVYSATLTSTSEEALRSLFVRYSGPLRSSMQEAEHLAQDTGSTHPSVEYRLSHPVEGFDSVQHSMRPGPSAQNNGSTSSLLEYGANIRASFLNNSGLGFLINTNRSRRLLNQDRFGPQEIWRNTSTSKLLGRHTTDHWSPRQSNAPAAAVDKIIDKRGVTPLVTERDGAGPLLRGSSDTVEYAFDSTPSLASSAGTDRRRWQEDGHLIAREENRGRSTRRILHHLKLPRTSGRLQWRPETTRATDDEPRQHIEFGIHRMQRSDDEETTNKSRVIKDYFCAGSPDAVSKAGLSFPSGHTAAACYTGTYIVAYVVRRGDAVASKWIRVTLVAVLLTASHAVAVIRVLEGLHGWWDVLAGVGLGNCWAVVCVAWPMS